MIYTHNIGPIIFSTELISVRWYGLFFAIGIILNFLLVRWIFKREGYSVIDLESIALYLFAGMFLGARLGHVFFYGAEYYLSQPIEILKVWKGGLSSHGAAIGVFIAYLVWIKIHKIRFNKYVDLLVLGMPITAGFVRIGNFFNSEIIGRATNGNWGVVFQKLGEDFPRHPSQIYEAFLSFMIFFVLFYVYIRWYKKLPKLFILFLYVLLYFITRFIVEFWKERHIITDDFPLSMGQILSILPILIAAGYFIYIIYKNKKAEK